jgi:hypothetical protein
MHFQNGRWRTMRMGSKKPALIPEELFQPRYAADRLKIFQIIVRLELAGAHWRAVIKSRLANVERESVLMGIRAFRNLGVAILPNPFFQEVKKNVQWMQKFVLTEVQ